MALSGSLNTTAYSGRYLQLSWSATQDIASNTSTISWTLKGAGGSDIYYKAGAFKVVIAGETVYSSSTRIQLYNGTTVASGTKKIQHNSDGKKSFTASVEAAIYYSAVNCKGSKTWDLNDIPRKATITNAPAFTDEDNIYIEFTNPSGGALQCSLVGGDGITYIPIHTVSNVVNNRYYLPFAETIREQLRAAFPHSTVIPVEYQLRTYIGGVYYTHKVASSITIVSEAPEVEITIKDVNSITLAETGNNQVFIDGMSFARYEIAATAHKGAYIASYEVVNGGITKTNSFGVYDFIKDKNFSFKITDSRGNSVVINKEINIIPYKVITTNLTVDTDIASGTDLMTTTLNIQGEFFVGSFTTNVNTLEIYYQYKVGNGEYGDRVRVNSVNIDADNGTYYAMAELTLNYKEAYTFRVIAIDNLNEATTPDYILSVLPVFDWSRTDFNFNVPVSFEGEQMADFVVAIGSQGMGSNGTWYWQKWKSGKAECWGKRNFGNVGFSTAWGGLYRSEDFTQTYPSGLFTAAPQLSLTLDSATSTCLIATGGTNASKTTTPTFHLIRPNTTVMSQAYINFYAVGRWK